MKTAIPAAQKVLGPQGKIPKPRVDQAALSAQYNKALASFNSNRVGLEKALLDLENACSQGQNTFRQYADILEASSLGLDEKKPEDKKKIDAAKDILLKACQKVSTDMDENLDLLRKLDRVITDLRRLGNVKL